MKNILNTSCNSIDDGLVVAKSNRALKALWADIPHRVTMFINKFCWDQEIFEVLQQINRDLYVCHIVTI